MLKEFRDFLMRGNLVELAVAFVMGLAFAGLIGSFIGSFVEPFISLVVGEPDLSGLSFTVNDSVFTYGSFITVVITFVTTAAAVFVFIVKPTDVIRARTATSDDAVTDEERRHQELLAALKAPPR